MKKKDKEIVYETQVIYDIHGMIKAVQLVPVKPSKDVKDDEDVEEK